ITKFKKFNEDSFNLLSIIDNMQSNDSLSKYKLNGLLFFTSKYDLNAVSNFLIKNSMDFNHELIT
ncbi:MAG: hypothetical protein WCJ72_20480, partial [Chryseobacterium sp.]